MNWIESRWYRRSVLIWLFLPLTLLYALVTSLRRLAYRRGWFRQYKMDVPVVIVGNITVGGNGKTPLVIRLAQILRQQGYHPGILSRGYGAKADHYPFEVGENAQPSQAGDEPTLMKQHLNCPIVIDPDRVRGARYLQQQCHVDVIICDDGLQHYRLARDIEIAVEDGVRLRGNGYLMPMGPLREPVSRLEQVDFVISNGGIAPSGHYLMSLQSGHLVNVLNSASTLSPADISQPIVAMAGIGHPERFFTLLEQKGVVVSQRISLPDHHQFAQQDIPAGTVLMTEKDAVKCRQIAHADCWYLPVTANLTDEFKQRFLTTLKQIKKKR